MQEAQTTDNFMKALNPYGCWRVTTEGDEEGRTTRDLGTHEGFIDEIALALADRAYFTLSFERQPDPKTTGRQPTATEVYISVDIPSAVVDKFTGGKKHAIEFMLRERDVLVDKKGYGDVTLVAGASEEARRRKANEIKRRAALAKLTPEDREALGLAD